METACAAKCAFVTGGSRGIGKGIALVLAEQGYDVAITYATAADEAMDTKASVEALGRRCFVYQAELQLPDVPERVTRQAIADLGHLDALVNNAGVTKHNSLFTTEVELMDFVYGLDFRAPILCAKQAALHMRENGIRGSIINITSTRGFRSYPEDALYGAAKAGLTRATESMALELAPYGIRMNCVAPGATRVRGDMSEEGLRSSYASKIPLGRFGTPRENGYAVAWLCSEQAAYITGTTLKIDGGLILPGMPEDPSPEAGYGWNRMRMKQPPAEAKPT
jgi:NAD(P)-dependent dehydrogenase (short-subunit alcohol dehydrogenase family)